MIRSYGTLAATLGRTPTSSDLPRSLSRRITRTFGSFERFWLAVGERPPRRGRTTDDAGGSQPIAPREAEIRNLVARWAKYLPFGAIPHLHHDHVVFDGNHEPAGRGRVRLKHLPVGA